MNRQSELSELSKECRWCEQVDRCNKKRMEGYLLSRQADAIQTMSHKPDTQANVRATATTDNQYAAVDTTRTAKEAHATPGESIHKELQRKLGAHLRCSLNR